MNSAVTLTKNGDEFPQNPWQQRKSLPQIDADREIIGHSRHMQELRSYLSKVAVTDSTVLITGETGTGKELVASLIHRKSARQKKPFVCINCAAIPESLIESEMFGYERGAFTGAVGYRRGKFEQAQGGTLFLDEIGDMSPFAQAKILRSIESKEVYPLGGKGAIPLDIRIIAATNQNPEELREDLYYRLNVARVHLPPLRDRKEDIPHLVDHTIKELNQRLNWEVEGLTDEAMNALLQYYWPGNVRELKNLLEATFINLYSRRISYMDFPDIFRKRLRFSENGFTSERDMVLAALSSTNWNKTEAAKKLNWSRMKIYRTLKRHKINFTQQKS
jgi:transcriptional regulator with PAS, ATPase and Fis domain